MADFESSPSETDERFPSGRWTGFFLQEHFPGRNMMSLRLDFRGGFMRGEGRDRVGEFEISGTYQVADGKCRWTKGYLDKHDVSYDGFNEGKGIWGMWSIAPDWRGGFHIWPVPPGEGEGDPDRLSAKIEEPVLAGAEA